MIRQLSSVMALLVLFVHQPATAQVARLTGTIAPWTPQQDEDDRLRGAETPRFPLDADGHFVGRLGLLRDRGPAVTSQELSLNFVQRGRVVVEDVHVDAQGTFRVPLEAGRFSMVAVGDEGFLSFGVRLESGRNGRAQFDATAIPASDFGPLGEIIRRQRLFDAADILPPVLDANDESSPAGNIREFRLREGGSLVGRVAGVQALRGRPMRLRIYFLQNGEEVASAAVNRNGQFRVTGLQPGVVSVVAAGVDGFSAFAVKAVASDAPRTAAFRQAVDLPVSVVPPEDLAAVKQLIRQHSPALNNAMNPPASAPPVAPAPPAAPTINPLKVGAVAGATLGILELAKDDKPRRPASP